MDLSATRRPTFSRGAPRLEAFFFCFCFFLFWSVTGKKKKRLKVKWLDDANTPASSRVHVPSLCKKRIKSRRIALGSALDLRVVERWPYSRKGERSVKVFLPAASKSQSLAMSHSISCVHVVPKKLKRSRKKQSKKKKKVTKNER